MLRWLAVLVALSAFVACRADERVDAVLQRTLRIGNTTAAEVGLVYWGARTRVHDDAHRRLIFDLDAKTVTFVDKGARTYIVRTLDEVLRKRNRPQPDTIAADLVLTRTENTEQIAGYPSRQYTFTGGRVRGSVWVTEAVRPPPVWREWEPVIAYLEGSFAGGEGVTKAVADLNGYPLRTMLSFVGSGPQSNITAEVSAVAFGPPAEDLTVIPADYRRANDVPVPG
jgi:hypothetical protein